nr:E3 binding domain-containing protein [Streptomyces sp. NA02950]
MDEGTLQEWLVQPGDLVHKGDPVAVVETAKSTIEVECFETGTVGQLLVEPGTTVPVGTALALIEPTREERRTKPKQPKQPKQPKKPGKPQEAERAEERLPVQPAPKQTKPLTPAEPSPARVPVPPAAQVRGHIEAGPLIRHLAETSGVDLATVHGSGPGGRVTRADIEQAAAAATAARQSRVRASPLARRLAVELDVDLAADRHRQGFRRPGRGRTQGSRRSGHRGPVPAPRLRPGTSFASFGGPGSGHASGDRRPDDARQPGHPALLPGHNRRHGRCDGLAP